MQTKQLELEGHVRFLGRVEEELLPLAYAACDAFVLPTAALECFGLIALEALSSGRPVLATPVGAIPELLNRFQPSWLAASASPEAIAAVLRKFLLEQLPQEAPCHLHAQVQSEFSRKQVLASYVDAILRG
jgi:glycosyltransferase involved in cell wall biosynthesis